MEVTGDKLSGNFLPPYLGRARTLLDTARTRWLDVDVKKKIYIYIYSMKLVNDSKQDVLQAILL